MGAVDFVDMDGDGDGEDEKTDEIGLNTEDAMDDTLVKKRDGDDACGGLGESGSEGGTPDET